MSDRLKLVLHTERNEPYCLVICEDHASIRSPLPRLLKALVTVVDSHERTGRFSSHGSLAIDIVHHLSEIAPLSLEPHTLQIAATLTINVQFRHGQVYLRCSRQNSAVNGSVESTARLPIDQEELDPLHSFEGSAQQLGLRIEDLLEPAPVTEAWVAKLNG